MPARQQAIIWTNDALVYWRIYVSLGLNELTHQAIPGTNADLLSIRPTGTNCSKISITKQISMAYGKTAVTPSLTHWSYYCLALSHRYNLSRKCILIKYQHIYQPFRSRADITIILLNFTCNILSGLGSIPGTMWAGANADCSTSTK